MKILMVNKFLYPNGGSETYIFELGKELQKEGHEVQYFGMEHAGRIVGNNAESYTSDMDFRGGSKLSKLFYPFKIIYSREARIKIRAVLDDFKPDVVHLNNINFQLTPSIILEIRKWEKQSGSKVKIVATIHDPQWVCPNHMMINGRGEKCQACLKGGFGGCVKYRCVHGSLVKSILGAMEARFYRILGTYKRVDTIIAPSDFMAQTISNNPDVAGRVVMLRNFIAVEVPTEEAIYSRKLSLRMEEDTPYVLYFGRYSEEKGIHTLVNAARALPEIQFVFAGGGPFEEEVNETDNIINVGFANGLELFSIIAGAQFSLIASEVYENCPFTVMEAMSLGTPVIGASIGGIPELIDEGVNGDLFASGDADELRDKIYSLWVDSDRLNTYRDNCKKVKYDNIVTYADKMIEIYSR